MVLYDYQPPYPVLREVQQRSRQRSRSWIRLHNHLPLTPLRHEPLRQQPRRLRIRHRHPIPNNRPRRRKMFPPEQMLRQLHLPHLLIQHPRYSASKRRRQVQVYLRIHPRRIGRRRAGGYGGGDGGDGVGFGFLLFAGFGEVVRFAGTGRFDEVGDVR